jgi:hypothetical protein
MSRHHMLPPVIHTPPEPKKIEKKKRRPAIGALDETDETTEAIETSAASPTVPVAVKLPPTQMPEIEGSDRKPQGPAGRLSQDTLTALLRAQELN